MSKEGNRKKSKPFSGGALWKKKQTICTFTLDDDGIDSTIEALPGLLLELGYAKAEALRLSFSLDALLLVWREHGLENAPAELFIEKVFGQRKLVIEARGGAERAAQEELSQSYPWMENLKRNGLAWSSAQTAQGMRGELVLSKKGMTSGAKLLVAVAAAGATVLALSALPGNVFAAAIEIVFNPLFDIGVGLLTALIGPMVFLSIMQGILGVGDISAFRQLGSRVLANIMKANAIGLIVATLGALAILGGNFAFGGGSANFGEECLGLLLGIVPTSFFQPFIEGNVLQLSIWAVLFGVVALMMKSRIPVVSDAVFELNSLVQQVIICIARIMPVFIYLAFVRILSNITPETLLVLLRLLVVVLFTAVLGICILTALAARRRKMGFGALLKIMSAPLTTAFLSASTAVSYSSICEAMKNLSIEESTMNFHTPIAISISHPGCILDIMLVAAMAACLGGHTISIAQLLLMMVLCFILGLAIPSVPGGGLAIYALVLTSMGFGLEALPLIIAVDPIADMTCTTLNVASIITAGLTTDCDLKSASENLA